MTGIVGRTVMTKVKRGAVVADEPCEVLAVGMSGEYNYFTLLVTTHDGTLFSVSYENVKLVATESGSGGPYR